MSSKSQLRALVQGNLEAHRLIVVSNREPFVHERRGDRIVCTQPAGGVTSALNPLLNWCSGVWVAHGSGSADRDTVDRNSHVMVPPDCPGYTLRRVWFSEKLRQEYYNGMANRGLWPLCHNAYRRPRFSSLEWESYRRVNEIYARAVLEEAGDEPGIVFIQDYHFALLPRMLKNQNPRLAVAHFWHIPWPDPETLSRFPWKEELLEGMLGSDLLGFQLKQHLANFVHSLDAASVAGIDSESGGVIESGRVFQGDHATTLRHFPIGIDFEGHCEIAGSPKTLAAIEAWKRRIGPGVRIGLGIDRIDYTKGIPERIAALDMFLERHPEWREKLVFVQVGVPSRGDIPEYRLVAEEIERQIAAVNERWRTATWQPIRFVRENLPPEEMIALHRISDFCLVTSLHDGMNLVAKEFVASRPDLDGVLVLSRFAGSSVELASATLVNPFSEEEIADGIFTALNLSKAERRRRMARMRAIVQANDIYHWAADILSALVQVTGTGREAWVPAAQPTSYGAHAGITYA
jgi:trehalose-6-phosphate synthase